MSRHCKRKMVKTYNLESCSLAKPTSSSLNICTTNESYSVALSTKEDDNSIMLSMKNNHRYNDKNESNDTTNDSNKNKNNYNNCKVKTQLRIDTLDKALDLMHATMTSPTCHATSCATRQRSTNAMRVIAMSRISSTDPNGTKVVEAVEEEEETASDHQPAIKPTDDKNRGGGRNSSTSKVSCNSISRFCTNKLYFREKEIQLLQETFQKTELHSKVVMIHGDSGTGKTSLVRWFLKLHTCNNYDHHPNGTFVMEGKFDSLQTTEPYPALVSAITSFICTLNKEMNSTVRMQIRQSFSEKSSYPEYKELYNAFIDIVPEIRSILTPSPWESENESNNSNNKYNSTVSTRNFLKLQSMSSKPTESSSFSSMIVAEQQQQKNRFRNALVLFLNHLATFMKKRIILFLDDIHWATDPDLDLLFSLVQDNTPRKELARKSTNASTNIPSTSSPTSTLPTSLRCDPGILFVFSYRDNKNIKITRFRHLYQDEVTTTNTTKTISGGSIVQQEHPKNTDCGIVQIRVTALNRFQVEQMVQQMINELETTSFAGHYQQTNNNNPPIPVQMIAEFIWTKSRGNLFFVQQYLRTIIGKLHEASPTAALEQITIGPEFYNIEILLSTQMSKLSKTAQDCLMIASCIGRTIPCELMQYLISIPSLAKSSSIINTTSSDDKSGLVLSSFEEMQNQGWVTYDNIRQRWTFAHDAIQSIAYQRIPTTERIMYHYQIGKMLWRKLSMDQLISYLFVVVGQFVIAKEHISCQNERVAIAKLLLTAGEYSVHCSAFHNARTYFLQGIELLGRGSWRDEYELCLHLHCGAAECSFSSGYTETVHSIRSSVVNNARCIDDTFRIRIIDLNALTVGNHITKALADGIDLLKLLGEKFPRKPKQYHCSLAIARIKVQLTRLTNTYSGITSDMNFPIMTDSIKLTAMQVLHQVLTAARLTDPLLSTLVGIRMAKLTLDYGISDVSCLGMVFVAGLFCSHGYVELGTRVGQVSWSMYEKFQNRSFLPRYYYFFYRYVHIWKSTEYDCSEPLWYAHRTGQLTGDIEYSSICGLCYHVSRFAFTPLHDVNQGLVHLSKQFRMLSVEGLVLILKPFLQGVQNLMGLAAGNPWLLVGNVFNEEHVDLTSVNPWCNKATYSMRALLYYLFTPDSRATMIFCKKLRDVTTFEFCPSFVSWLLLFDGLCCIARARKMKHKCETHATKCITTLRKWAKFGSDQFLVKQLLLEAEFMSLKSKTPGTISSTLKQYDAAIQVAKRSGSLLENGMISECLSKYIIEVMKDKEKAIPHIDEALDVYTRWGAAAKVHDLKAEMKVRFGVDVTF